MLESAPVGYSVLRNFFIGRVSCFFVEPCESEACFLPSAVDIGCLFSPVGIAEASFVFFFFVLESF